MGLKVDYNSINHCSDEEFQVFLKKYRETNASFDKKICFRVGYEGGFYSEVDGMMQCMMWCYQNKIAFSLYADDPNWGGSGWDEFFEPFCEMNHSRWNKFANRRHKLSVGMIARSPGSIVEPIGRHVLKKRYGIDCLTQDIFFHAIDRSISLTERIQWDLFGIDGCSLNEFGKLTGMALRYNQRTARAIADKINALGLPDSYCSTQMRGGDKITEFDKLHNVEETVSVIESKAPSPINNMFVLSDDYTLVSQMRQLRPEWNIYTLCREDERGYNNLEFCKRSYEEKKDDLIKLFAMVEICLRSEIHFGNGQSCLNNHIRSIKLNKGYVDLFGEYEQ